MERNAQRVPTRLGMTLEIGDRVSTGPGTRAVLAYGTQGSEVLMRAETALEIGSIRLRVGEILARVKQLFSVETKHFAAIPTGTEFLVRVDDGERVAVTVVGGVVAVESKAAAVPRLTLRAREQANAEGTQAPTKRTLDAGELNEIVEWVNQLERLIRPDTPKLLVPDLTGLDISDADRALVAQGLTRGALQLQASGQAAPGRVLVQSPAAGVRVEAGTTVNLTIETESVVSQPLIVPSLIGLSPADARRALAESRHRGGQCANRGHRVICPGHRGAPGAVSRRSRACRHDRRPVGGRVGRRRRPPWWFRISRG